MTERTQQGYSLTLSLHERGVRPAFMVSYFSSPALLQAPLGGGGLGGPALHVNIGLFPLRGIHPSPQGLKLVPFRGATFWVRSRTEAHLEFRVTVWCVSNRTLVTNAALEGQF